jgi:hypothetical protein
MRVYRQDGLHCIVKMASTCGSEDTELGVLMELELVMERRQLRESFKLGAVRLVNDRGVSMCKGIARSGRAHLAD